MNIKEFGGEFKLIERVTREGGAVVGVGDDAAVLEFDIEKYQLITCDMLCEGDHFRRNWSTPKQIGMKCMEVNVSDIAAMGGEPTYAVVSISLTDDVTVEFMDGLYEGMYSVADKYGFGIIGGDTTHSKTLTINVTMLGFVAKKNLCMRNGAEVGDLICVTGDLGGSMAGLQLKLNGVDGFLQNHLEPKSRLMESKKIREYAKSMIDVSDGLASEVNHICKQSNVGAIIFGEKVPLSKNTIETAKKLGENPLEYALNGGEDFELIFTVDEKDFSMLNLGCDVSVIGKIVEFAEGSKIKIDGAIKPLAGGYDHFKKNLSS